MPSRRPYGRRGPPPAVVSLSLSLEPCSHFGRTPPCAEALIAAGVTKVVAATRDPDSRVRGRGLEIMEGAGIETSVGLLEREAIDLDPGYHHHRRTGRPYLRVIRTGGLDRFDDAVRTDLDVLEDDIDRMVTGTDLPTREVDDRTAWNRLVRLGDHGFLDVGVRDEELVARLHRDGLIDTATVYSTRPTLEGEPVWTGEGYRLLGTRPVGSCYRIDLSRVSRQQVGIVRPGAEASIPTRYGNFRAIGYESLTDGRQHVALVLGAVAGTRAVLVRLHSECLTGDVFASLRCDCGFQLDEALRCGASGGGSGGWSCTSGVTRVGG